MDARQAQSVFTTNNGSVDELTKKVGPVENGFPLSVGLEMMSKLKQMV